MENIVKLEPHNIGNETVNCVNLRDLYKQLGSKQDFSDWAKNRLERANEGVDYIKLYSTTNSKRQTDLNLHKFMEVREVSNLQELPIGSYKIDYYVAIDYAKMICMLENNEVGDNIRKYFVDCEKKYQLRMASKYERHTMTDALKIIYGDLMEKNKLDGIKDWTYSNYTKLIYKKVFGKRKADDIKKMYNIPLTKNLRDFVPAEKLHIVQMLEYDVHCYLRTLYDMKCPVNELYDKIKGMLERKVINKNMG